MAQRQDLDAMFQAALALDSGASRDGYLDTACAGDAPLRQRMVKMIAAHDAAGSFLERPAVTWGANSPTSDSISESPGTVIGPYKLLQQIGEGGMGLDYRDCKVNVGIAVWFWGEYLGAGKLEKGTRIKTSSFTRHHINANMTKAKAGGNYMLFQMTRTEALRQGYDEALLLDPQGHVAEGSVENVFIVRNGELITPPLTYILEGITRDSVIHLARGAGLTVREEFFSRDTVYISDEVFFVGTGAEVTPVVELDDRPIADGRPGPVTKAMQKLYFDTVYGRNPQFSRWLTPANTRSS